MCYQELEENKTNSLYQNIFSSLWTIRNLKIPCNETLNKIENVKIR